MPAIKLDSQLNLNIYMEVFHEEQCKYLQNCITFGFTRALQSLKDGRVV